MLFVLLCLSAKGWGAPSFEKDIRPLLKAHCFHCHGEAGKKEGGVDLRLRRFMLKTTDEGPVMEPGNSEASLIVQLTRKGEMPKGEKVLTPAEVSLLEEWVRAGAPVSREEPESIPPVYITDEERNFWSFRPIVKPTVPVGEPNPIDALIAGPLRAEGLDFLREADRVILLRRLSFDLIGLPPTPEEMQAFVNDASPDAYEKQIDRLLASPHYGERWGQHWLDVAGYSDSNGQEEDTPRPHAWHYRDYVVRAHNENLPWDQFIHEQIAGDELLGTSHAQASQIIHEPGAQAKLTATGFIRMAPDPTGGTVADVNLARNQVMAETLKTVSTSLMGLTMGCAQCHDHRYDPVSQQDYFRLRAVFEPVYDWKKWRGPNERLHSLYTAEERQQAEKIEAEARQMDAERVAFAKNRLNEIFAERLAKVPEQDREPVRVARETEEGKRSPEQHELLKKYIEAKVGTDEGLLLLFDPEMDKKRIEMQSKATAHRATKPKENFLMIASEVTNEVPETFLHNRGDHDQPKEKIDPAAIEVLSSSQPVIFTKPMPELTTSGRRLAFAQWITDRKNPLTARVLVNRFWMHHFGRGLVRTPGDFGTLGEAPTHPELLDWLAADFTDHGWELKRLHRMILTSKTWRQITDPQSTSLRERVYCGAKLQRLDAESLRDSMLAVSGKLNLQMGGEPVSVSRDVATGRIIPGREVINPGNGMIDKIEATGENAFRRSLYIESRRSRPLTVLETFDLPLMNPNCTSRTVTTVAPQSLLLMNDAFTLEQATALAERLEREAPLNNLDKIQRTWTILFGTAPTPIETTRAMLFLVNQRESLQKQGRDAAKASHEALAAWCQVMLSTNQFLYIE